MPFVEEDDDAGGLGDVCKGFDVVMFEGADLVVGLFGGKGGFVLCACEHVRRCFLDISIDRKSYNLFSEDRKSDRVGGTTVVFDRHMYALYFSKELIPFFEISKIGSDEQLPCYHHVGVYAYRKNILKDYLRWPESNLEKLEGLEQLRFLFENKRVKCVEVNS